MGIFNDDPFDEIVREFFGSRPGARQERKSAVIKGEDDERTSDYIESDGFTYLIFELPGFSEADVNITVRAKELIIAAHKKKTTDVQDYLQKRLTNGIAFKRALPEGVSPKKFTHSMRNGVLEVAFTKQ